MKLFLSVFVVALVAGVVVADDSKGPKVTEKVRAPWTFVLTFCIHHVHTHTNTHTHLLRHKSSEMTC